MSTPNIQPRSAAQAAAARANGAKSKGPTSPEGKSTVSSNRMIHGFRSNYITLSTEDADSYEAHLDAYLARYSPADKTEEDLVGLLASSMWQIMRNNSIEIALFEVEIAGVAEHIEGQFEDMDQYGILALAFKKSAGDNALELLRRYKATAERAYHRALQALENMKKDRLQNPSPLQPEPQPDPPETLFAVQTRATPEPTPIHRPNQAAEAQPEAPMDQKPLLVLLPSLSGAPEDPSCPPKFGS